MFLIYHDEDAQRSSLVGALRRAGFDCLTTHEANMPGRSDSEQLAFATQHGRVLFTSNVRDFRRLDAQWWRDQRQHAGIIALTDQLTPIGVQVRALVAMGDLLSSEDMTNRLEYLLNYA